MGYVKWMDGLSKPLKILFAVLFMDITWMIYRIIKKAEAKDWKMMIVWILIVVFLGAFWWIVDIVTLIAKNQILEF